MSKSVQNDIFNAFYRENGLRIRRYVAMVGRMHGIAKNQFEDCLQSALLEASLALRYWQADGGLSAFNWCAGPMRRAILRCHRASLGARAYGHYEPPRWASLYDRHGAHQIANLEEIIDLHREIENDSKPLQVQRFMRIALDMANGVEIATEQGITKQSVSENMSKARARLRLKLSA